MTDDQFATLVARLEGEQARNPDAYRRRGLALAFAGYGYISAVLLVALVLLLGSLARKRVQHLPEQPQLALGFTTTP